MKGEGRAQRTSPIRFLTDTYRLKLIGTRQRASRSARRLSSRACSSGACGRQVDAVAALMG